MDDEQGGATAAHETDDVHGLWWQLEVGLTAYLSRMTDLDEHDHLLLELSVGDSEEGCAPYAQFAAFGDGTMLRAEISGNAYLAPQHHLGDRGCQALAEAGWRGNDDQEKNWFSMLPVESADEIAAEVVWALREHFAISHPQLLTYQAWGPAAAHVAVLGLGATDDVPVDDPQPPITAGPMQAVRPDDRDELTALVRAVLRTKYDAEPHVDDDGDFVVPHLGQPVFVRARADQPAVEIIARVAHGVHSRRAAAVEIGLLNRDNAWARWALHDRHVFMHLLIPAMPFVPQHLDDLLGLFLEAMSETRDDLALRLRAKVG